MREIQLFNTMTSRKEAFRPLKAGEASMYVCGITPYDESHLGHGRCYVVFDVLKRVLQNAGYKVRHVQNFTDIDDKIIDRANALGVSPAEHAEKFIQSYQNSMTSLNVKPADVYPRVTGHIDGIIKLIERLVQKGFGYESAGTVYYSVRKFPDYGKLSRRNVDELEAGARVDVDANKRDPLDFALWKAAKPGEPAWPSPWGPGRPGWHIECSAMSMSLLGEEFDIHGGGKDLVFPHHENEIAQSVGASGRGFARLWAHNGFVTVDQQKMSKSLGNFFTLKDIFARFDPMVVRYFLLTQHYRSPLDFSDQELRAAQTTWEGRVTTTYRLAADWHRRLTEAGVAIPPAKDEEGDLAVFHASLADDLNTPGALAALHGVCGRIFGLDAQKNFAPTPEHGASGSFKLILDRMFDVLGLVPRIKDDDLDPEIARLVAAREEARRARNWPESDRLRNELAGRGISIEDTPTGPRLKRLAPS